MANPTRIKGLLDAFDEALDMDAAYEAYRRLPYLGPNSTAAERAKALGFGDKEYHSTQKIFDNFDLTKNPKHERDLSHLGKDYSFDNSGYYWNNEGVYSSNNPINANFFGGLNKTNNPTEITPLPITLPLVINKSKYFDFKNPKHLEDIKKGIPSFDYKGNPIYKREDNYIGNFILDANGNKIPEIDKLTKKEINDISKGKHSALESSKVIRALKNRGYEGTNLIEPKGWRSGKNDITTNSFNSANIRSPWARFNPKKAGIPLLTGGAGGAFMSSNLLAAPKKPDQDLSRFAPKPQHEFRQAPSSLLDKAADAYQWTADEGGWLGEFLYSPGARALRHLGNETTPMVKTGRLKVPTGEALLDLMGILML